MIECNKKVEIKTAIDTYCYCCIVGLKIEKMTKNNDLIMVANTSNEFCCIMDAINV